MSLFLISMRGWNNWVSHNMGRDIHAGFMYCSELSDAYFISLPDKPDRITPWFLKFELAHEFRAEFIPLELLEFGCPLS